MAEGETGKLFGFVSVLESVSNRRKLVSGQALREAKGEKLESKNRSQK